MKRLYRRLSVLLSILLVLGVLYFFRAPVANICFRFFAQKQFPSLKDAKIEIGDVVFSGLGVVFKEVSVKQKASQHDFLHVDEFDCRLVYSPAAKKFCPSLGITGVLVDITTQKNEITPVSLEKIVQLCRVFQNSSIAIVSGALCFDQAEQPLIFHAKPSDLKGHVLSLGFGNSEKLQGRVDLYVKHHAIYASCHFYALPLHRYGPLIERFGGCGKWQGSVEGTAEIGVSGAQTLEHLATRLTVENLSVNGSRYSVQSKELSMDLALKEGVFPEMSYGSVKDWLSWSLVDVQCRDLSIECDQWALRDAHLSCDDNHSNHQTARLGGVLCCGLEQKHLECVASLNACQPGSIGVDVNLEHEKKVRLSGDWEHLLVQGTRLTPFALNFFPRYFLEKPFFFRRGEISFEAQFFTKSRQCVLSNLEAFHFEVQGDTYCLGAETLLAKGIWGDEKGGDLILKNGNAYYYDEKILDGVNGELGFSAGVLKPSHLKGIFYGVEGDLSLDGDLSALHYEVHTFLPSQQVSSAGILSFLNRKVEGEGKLGIADDHWVDTLSVSLSIDRAAGWFCPIEWDKVQGDFSAKNLSDRVYGVLLEHFHTPWKVKGIVDIAGHISGSMLDLDVIPVEVQFDSRDLLASVSTSEKLCPYHFKLDFLHELWEGYLPVRNAQFFVKKPQLTFHHVSADGALTGLTLTTKNLQASSEGIDFKAALTFSGSGNKDSDVIIDVSHIEGDAGDLIGFLRHFDDMSQLNLPICGPVQADGISHIEVHEKEGVVETEQQFALRLYQGRFTFSEHAEIKDLNVALAWNSVSNQLHLDRVDGLFVLGGEREMEFVAKQLKAHHLKEGIWEYDFRVGNRVHDVIRIKGCTEKFDDRLECCIDRDHSFFLTSKLDAFTLTLGSDYRPQSMHVSGAMTADEFMVGVDLAVLCGVLAIPEEGIKRIKDCTFDGEGNFDIGCDFNEKRTDVRIDSTGWTVDKKPIGPIDVHIEIGDQQIVLKKGVVGSFSVESVLSPQNGGYRVESLHCFYRDHELTLSGGEIASDRWQLSVDDFTWNLASGGSPITGVLHGKGELVVDFNKEQEWTEVSGNLLVGSQNLGKGEYTLKTLKPFSFACNREGVVSLEKLQMQLFTCDENLTHLQAASLQYEIDKSQLCGNGMALFLPPEMVLALIEKESIPGICVIEGHKIKVADMSFDWENQVEGEFDFIWSPDHRSAHGLVKEGYYWVGDRSWHMKDCAFNFQNSQLKVAASVDFEALTLDMSLSAHFGRESLLSLSVSEPHKETERPLTINARYKDKEGLQVLGVEGELHGLTCHFTRNPRAYLPYQLILSGQLLIDAQQFSTLLPDSWQEKIRSYALGDGYELSGDLVIALKDLTHTHFKGYLKGRDFLCGGCILKTLFSAVDINKKGVFFYDFRLSDAAGVMAAKSIDLHRLDQQWTITVNEFSVQDFRPSLLRILSHGRGPLRPFLIKELYLFNFQGTVGNFESFSGRGHLEFVNTFKRDYHLLDIPIDIIGRLGLDLGLFVPVRGKLQYQIEQGHVHLTELTSCYSDGERSQFYLSPSKCSAIDFDGRLNIDIRMKQYVLLKITQPLTLTVRGSIFKPRYGVK